MRSRRPTRTAAIGSLLAAAALVASASLVLAKEGGIVTLAKPIPLDAEPGSTITVEFDAMVLTEDGPRPIEGSSMVVRLTGPDGAVTEALATQRGRPGTYVAQVEVPAGGVDRADFGLRGTAVGADGSSMVEDIPFAVDGVLFALRPDTVDVAAADPPAATEPEPSPSSAPDAPVGLLALIVGLGVAGLAAAGLFVVGRRRTLRST